MESTKAKLQETTQQIYDAVIKAVPKGTVIDPLKEEEEIEGVFAIFFTSKGSRGLSVGAFDEQMVVDYVDEILLARDITMKNGSTIVSTEALEKARAMRMGET
jgi:hypothetical protein